MVSSRDRYIDLSSGPDGLPPPVAWYEPAPGHGWRTFTSSVVGLGLVAVVVGLRGPSIAVAVFSAGLVLLLAGLVGWGSARTAVVAGPGWLSVRDVWGWRWVRTDELVEVKASWAGFGVRLTLRDAARRRLFVELSDLRRDLGVVEQFVLDVQRSLDGGLPVSRRTRDILLQRRNH